MKKLIAIAIVSLAIVVTGCSKTQNEENVSNNQALTFIMVSHDAPDTAWIRGRFCSDPMVNPSDVNATVTTNTGSYTFSKEWYGGIIYFRGEWIPEPENNSNVRATVSSQTFGRCEGEVTYPGLTFITQPINGTTFQFEQDIVIQWSSPSPTDFYAVDLDIYIYDTTWHHVTYIDTIINTTTFTLSGTNFPNLPNGAYYDVDISVEPINGAIYNSNMHGDFNGFLACIGKGDEIHIYVGPHKKSIKRKSHLSHERVRRILREKLLRRFRQIMETDEVERKIGYF